jgi:hypothetical protein
MLIVFVIAGLKARGAVFALKSPGNPASFFRKNEDGPAGQARGDDERERQFASSFRSSPTWWL